MIRMNDEVIARFEKENPDIKIKAEWGVNSQKHLIMFARGVPPDVSFWPWGPAKLVAKDVLMPLDDLIENKRQSKRRQDKRDLDILFEAKK